MPVATILALVLLFSAYMVVDGAIAIYAAFERRANKKAGVSCSFKASPAWPPPPLHLCGQASPWLPSCYS
jgi:hypothetical protein